MTKRPDLVSELLQLGMFAPIVAATRLQMLAWEAASPTRRGRAEMTRMTAEKPAAALEAVLAAQQSLLASGLKLWSDCVVNGSAFLQTAPALSLAAGAAPIRRRVRRNARRLTGL